MALREIVLGLWLLTGGTAAAETFDYDVTYGPLRVGRLTLRAESRAPEYRAALSIRSAGLAGVVRAVRFEGQAFGRQGDLPRPQRYVERADTGRRVSQAELRWRASGPRGILYHADPVEEVPAPGFDAVQGALDPASAFLVVLSGPQICGQHVQVFDGQRLSALVLETGISSEDGLRCAGHYRRIAGYRPQDMAERQDFALRLRYVAEGAGHVLAEAEVQTLYGKVRLKRR